jgi:FAD/FMN-containing dehydrogenase
MSQSFESWGRYPSAPKSAQAALPLSWRDAPLPLPKEGGSVLPYGLGRSYGDSCLNLGGSLLPTTTLDRFLAFDPATGVLTCEAGVSFDAILRLVVPQGWFLPVTPGTKFVTVGGAIANDVHGKNHHAMGTFGCHVRRLELLRSDGGRRVCSPSQDADLFAATVGGLGLTGVILWAEVQLSRIANPYVVQETVPMEGLADFFRINRESERDFVYTVSWVDCLARGKKVGRGLFYRANNAPPQLEALPAKKSHLNRRGGGLLAVPFDLPSFTLNALTVRAFNFAYHRAGLAKPREALVHYEPFYYPLDGVHRWNRIYGRKGFLQFQCVVPHEAAEAGVMAEILERIGKAGLASFLAVLKTFGPRKSPGLLSFPRPGVTLALDFSYREGRTERLLRELEQVTMGAGGALYPAKDACMLPGSFAASFPELPRFLPHVDPAFSSSFWRRVEGGGKALAALSSAA